MDDLKHDIKQPSSKKAAKDTKPAAALVGKASAPVKKEAPKKKSPSVNAHNHKNHLSTHSKVEAPKSAAKKPQHAPVQSIVQVKKEAV